jgi:muconate cycloisomerase
LASGDTARDIAEAERKLEEGRHRDFKLKIGSRTVAEDCQHAIAIAQAIGERGSVRVDINQRWTRAEANEGLARLQDGGIVLAEQPLAKSDITGMADLTARFDIMIMADEALEGPADASAFVQGKAADVLAIKIAQQGGMTSARLAAEIGSLGHLGVYGGTMLEGPVGTIASAHCFAALPRLDWGTELFGPLLLAEDLLVTPLEYRNYCLTVPSGPGLGIVVDREKVERFSRTV